MKRQIQTSTWGLDPFLLGIFQNISNKIRPCLIHHHLSCSILDYTLQNTKLLRAPIIRNHCLHIKAFHKIPQISLHRKIHIFNLPIPHFLLTFLGLNQSATTTSKMFFIKVTDDLLPNPMVISSYLTKTVCNFLFYSFKLCYKKSYKD